MQGFVSYLCYCYVRTELDSGGEHYKKKWIRTQISLDQIVANHNFLKNQYLAHSFITVSFGFLLSLADLENPFRLDVFESKIYWTTGAANANGKVKAQDKLGRGIPTIEVRNIALPKGIRIYQEQRYKLDPPSMYKGLLCCLFYFCLCVRMPSVVSGNI